MTDTEEMLSGELEVFIDRLGLRHFKGREFTPYWDSKRGKVKNTVPPSPLWPRIVPTLIVLDEVRERLGYAIRLTSTYRKPAYNAAVGGEPNSFHMRFMAVDWQGRHGSPPMWAACVKSLRGKRFVLPGNGGDFLFGGGVGVYPTFVHVDCRPAKAGGPYANW